MSDYTTPAVTGSGQRRFAAVLFCAASFMMGFAADCCAQDLDRYAPNRPVSTSGRRCRLPSHPINPAEGSFDVLVGRLNGVMIVESADRVQDPIATFDGLRIDPAADLDVAREDLFVQAVRQYIGQPISTYMLSEMSASIVRVYKQFGQPVVDVAIPAGQDITDGMVQVVITEARIGAIRFEGNCWFSDCTLKQQSWLQPGQKIYEPCLHQELFWYNKSPYRCVGMRFEPGMTKGTTDIVYNVRDQQPVRYFAGYSDSGPRVTSRERLLFGFNFGNVGGQDRQLSYQFETDAQLDGTIGVHS